MSAEFDYDLNTGSMGSIEDASPARSRTPYDESTGCREPDRASSWRPVTGDGLVITPRGRSVLLRGSPRLWDVAA